MPIGNPSDEEAGKRVDDAIKLAAEQGDTSMENILSIVRKLAEQDAARDAALVRQINA